MKCLLYDTTACHLCTSLSQLNLFVISGFVEIFPYTLFELSRQVYVSVCYWKADMLMKILGHLGQGQKISSGVIGFN